MATYHKKTDKQAPKQLHSSEKNKGRYLSDNRQLTNPIQPKRARTLKVPTISPQPIQRAMFYDPTSETYKRMKKHPDTGKYEEKEGPYEAKGDRKLTVLHQIAEKVRAAKPGWDFGPHIAISIMGGKIYAGINEVYNTKKSATKQTAITQDQLKNAVYKGVGDWLQPYRGSKGIDDENALWVEKAYKKGKADIHVAMAQSKTSGPASGAWHGEIAVAKAMMDNLGGYRTKKDNTPNGMKKVLRIGGTKTNCRTCFNMLHGGLGIKTGDVGGKNLHTHTKSSGETLNAGKHKDLLTAGESMQSTLDRIGKNQFKFLTGGTHGGQFPGANHVESMGFEPNPTTKIKDSTIFQPDVPKAIPKVKSLPGYDQQTKLAELHKKFKESQVKYAGDSSYTKPDPAGDYEAKKKALEAAILKSEQEVQKAEKSLKDIDDIMDHTAVYPADLKGKLSTALTALISALEDDEKLHQKSNDLAEKELEKTKRKIASITKELENTKKRTTALISEKSKFEELKEKPEYKIKSKDSEIKSSSEKEKKIEKHISDEKLVLTHKENNLDIAQQQLAKTKKKILELKAMKP